MSIHRIRQVGDGSGGMRCKKCNKIIIDDDEKLVGLCHACKLDNVLDSNTNKFEIMREKWKQFHESKNKKMMEE